MRKKSILILIIFSNLALSCEKILMKPDAPSDNINIFEEVWSFTDRHYSFFEYKDIDWDHAYSSFRPFVNQDISSIELFDICAAMLYLLEDGHVNLVSPFDRSRYWEWYLESPDNFNYSLIERNYYRGKQRYIGPLEFIVIDNIVYVYYSSFANMVTDLHLDILIASLPGKDGLIIDVRNNGGGSTQNAKKIASRFTDEKVHVGVNMVKTGPGHNDFRKEDIHINPHDGLQYDGNVVLLTNRRSYSATTYFTQYMRELLNVTVIGDATGGGGGMPAFHDLPNGWLLRVSSTQFITPVGDNIESGIPPDLKIDMTESSVREGKDDIIEEAIRVIKNSN